MGNLADALKVIPAFVGWCHNQYLDHYRYRLAIQVNGRWRRSFVAPVGVESVRLKLTTRIPDEFSECRLSPQNKPWWKLIGHENENSGVFRITKATLLIPEYDGECTDRDDEQQGRWVIFKPPFSRNGGANLDFECQLSATKPWRGKIGFLQPTPRGRRLTHVKIKII